MQRTLQLIALIRQPNHPEGRRLLYEFTTRRVVNRRVYSTNRRFVEPLVDPSGRRRLVEDLFVVGLKTSRL